MDREIIYPRLSDSQLAAEQWTAGAVTAVLGGEWAWLAAGWA